MNNRTKLVLVLSTLALSTAAFLARERGKARNRPVYDANLREARITFEDFTATLYESGIVTSVARAKSGYLLEPNMLELFGDVSFRTRKGDRKKQYWEQLYCETATAYFRSNSLAQMITSSSMDHIDLRGFVKIETKGMTLETDSAVYTQANGILQSSATTQLSGPGHNLKGEGGFSFDLRREELNMFGPIRGGGSFEMP